MCECGHGLKAFGTQLACFLFGGQWIAMCDAIKDIMYVVVRESGHVVWKEWWYPFTSGVSL
jgi:hypothetical protein